MKVISENGREMVEYEEGSDHKVYTDAERYAEGEDFSDRISKDNLPEGLKGNDKQDVSEEVLEKVRGLNGYKRLTEAQKKTFLKEAINGEVE